MLCGHPAIRVAPGRLAATPSAAASALAMQAGTPTPCSAAPATASPGTASAGVLDRAHPVEVPDRVLRQAAAPALHVHRDRRGGDPGEHGEVGPRTGDQLGVVDLQRRRLAEPAQRGPQPHQAVGRRGARCGHLRDGVRRRLDRQRARRRRPARRTSPAARRRRRPGRRARRRRTTPARSPRRAGGGGHDLGQQPRDRGRRDGEHHGVDVSAPCPGPRTSRQPSARRCSARTVVDSRTSTRGRERVDERRVAAAQGAEHRVGRTAGPRRRTRRGARLRGAGGAVRGGGQRRRARVQRRGEAGSVARRPSASTRPA